MPVSELISLTALNWSSYFSLVDDRVVQAVKKCSSDSTACLLQILQVLSSTSVSEYWPVSSAMGNTPHFNLARILRCDLDRFHLTMH